MIDGLEDARVAAGFWPRGSIDSEAEAYARSSGERHANARRFLAAQRAREAQQTEPAIGVEWWPSARRRWPR